MQLINTQAEFNAACLRLQQQPIIFMDTEFCRRRTYYAKLCLVQVAADNEIMIFDSLAIEDLQPLKLILADQKIRKVLHAARQDIEIFLHLFKQIPLNIFDTQIAAGVVGYDPTIGYGRLCRELLYVKLDKSLQTADWQARPLIHELLNYAARDVEHLPILYRELYRAIDNRNLWDTYKSRSQELLDKDYYLQKTQPLLRRMYVTDKDHKLQQNLASLIEFREECAQILDVPRNRCASDAELIQLATYLPKNEQELKNIKIFASPLLRKRFKIKLFELCAGLSEDIST